MQRRSAMCWTCAPSTQPWAETATWNTQPAPGASYAHGGTLSASLLQIDLSTLAMQWLNGEVTEASVALLPGGPGVDVTLGSREGQRPARLIVQCEPKPALKLTDPQAHSDQQEQAIARLQAESSIPVSVLFANGALQQSTFDVIGAGGVVTDALAIWFLDTHRDLLGTDDAWQLIRRSPDGQHEFFRQVHEGIPVYPAEIAVDLNGNRVIGAGGNYVPVVALPPTPSLSAEQAEQIAINAIDPAATVLGDTQLSYMNLGLLGHADKTTHLAWRMALRTGAGDYTVLVDAHRRRHPLPRPAQQRWLRPGSGERQQRATEGSVQHLRQRQHQRQLRQRCACGQRQDRAHVRLLARYLWPRFLR